MNHITINIVLDDTSLENSCLHYVPGSHRWPFLAPVSFGQDMEASGTSCRRRSGSVSVPPR